MLRCAYPYTLIVLIATTACGGASQNPTSPSVPAAFGSTASIVGTAQPVIGITVSVVGTPIATALDAAGRFTLNDVPVGDVRLKFSGPAVDATLSLACVQAHQTITLVVRVESGSAIG